MQQRSDLDVILESRVRPAAFGLLYERHAPAVFRYLARRAGAAAAEDLLGDVFVAALTTRRRVRPHPSGSALPWLYGIAGNVLRSHLRRTRPARHAAADAGFDWDAVDARLDAGARRDQLQAALAVLSDVDRELLLLVAWEGLPAAEAGAALGLTPVAARSRLHRARSRAQAALDATATAAL